MTTRISLLSPSLASAGTVARLTGYKYQPLEVESCVEHASGLVETIAGFGRAARRGRYKISELAPLGQVWTLPVYPVRAVLSVMTDGVDVTGSVSLENDCQIRYKSWDLERLHDSPPVAEAVVEAGYDVDEAPMPILLAVAVVVDMMMSQTTVGPRELRTPGLMISLPSVAEAVKGVIGAP